jgi:hypothetical protein
MATKDPSHFPSFWSYLNVCWREEDVNKWVTILFSSDSEVENCFNLICLNSVAHDLWSKGHFVLKPLSISDDRKMMNLEFYWQYRYKHKWTDKVDLTMVPISSRDLDGVDRNTGLYNRDRAVGRPICTGDVFELTTDDPSKYPLPSMDLLDMQWKLQRMVGMKGAAEAIDLTDEGSSESYNGAKWTSMEEIASRVLRLPLRWE